MYQNEFGRPTFNGQYFGNTSGFHTGSTYPSFTSNYPLALGSTEIGLLQQRVDILGAQLSQLIEVVLRNNLTANSGIFGQSQLFGATAWTNVLRTRESDSHLFWDISLPNLTTGDIEVEVVGNRVVCRTRVPVRTNFRAFSTTELPRGFDVFELADGRVEFNWVIPVSFTAKAVEAICTERGIMICIPKAEANVRHSVKVTKEQIRKNSTSHEMTA